MNQTELDEFNQQLGQLALSAQQHPPLSPERQSALRSLVQAILRSGRLCRPQQGKFSGFYQDIYDEALQELMLFICQHVERYNPERGTVMAWVNMLLDRRFFREAIPKVLGRQDVQRVTLSDLDNLTAPEPQETLTEKLKACVDQDPEDILKAEYIKDHPAATFQVLLQRRILGKSWKEISAEFDLKIPTVSSFYYRCLTKFSTRLKEYCTHDAI
ncbi:sigma-70 family RNA polymerase sigma factor [Oculatella sp. FACHB-28]|uniref:sigma-70 family RNA polymerase sigma factor n=1 Tax=Oculatella sp. FACHB-28 TaxID=2692845 RepID=UPI001689CFF9|nr:sigma-70 family RNA polymerase sigma factor [Oculatella sp. FACHB-28]MBD1867994.1 sigma-70 family RNA polymerase sigma factor [Cyanobacteria bacterium FACHB-471]MBD2059434.1 sigma-70 family RNA polymerase sigma factor [Oculatella sp. FACHB-28]